ncbi:hypothetical protein ACHZ98_35325 [Streptomyces sp. MAR4 CNY-716]
MSAEQERAEQSPAAPADTGDLLDQQEKLGEQIREHLAKLHGEVRE